MSTDATIAAIDGAEQTNVSMRVWLRAKPSGYVHYVVGAGARPYGAYRRMACGKIISIYRLTDDYPPRVRRCLACLEEAEE